MTTLNIYTHNIFGLKILNEVYEMNSTDPTNINQLLELKLVLDIMDVKS